MNNKIKNSIIICLTLIVLIMSTIMIKNNNNKDIKVSDEENSIETNDNENINYTNNDIKNDNVVVEENSLDIKDEILIEAKPIAKAGSIRLLKYKEPERNINYDNIDLIEGNKIVQFLLQVVNRDIEIKKIYNEYNELDKNSDNYNNQAIKTLNNVFAAQDKIVDDVKMINYKECYEILFIVYAKNMLMQKLIDAHIQNDDKEIESLKIYISNLDDKYNERREIMIKNLKELLDE